MNQLPTTILLSAFSSLVSAAPVAVSEFSALQASDPLPDNWKSIEFENVEQQTRYSLVTEERDITEDYQAAFGEPQTAITSIAVMTDTDNTGGSATAWYGDIWFQ